MKNIIIFMGLLLLYGCATNPFNIDHLERISCIGMRTPWANDTKRDGDGLYWYINKDGWRSKALPKDVLCIKEIMSREELAKFNEN